MLKNFFISIFFICTIATSCKTVQKITNKDSSTANTQRKKGEKKVEFIDGIEVAPGSIISSKHKPNTTKTATNIAIAPNVVDGKNTNINIEKLSLLQYKYAIRLDTYVENIANFLLYNKLEEWWATPYHYGGNSKSGIDCSAFTGTMLKDVYGITLPRTAFEQFNVCEKIMRADLQEGDLVFFNTRGGVSHVGIYLCNNKFAHASTKGGVMISDLYESYWYQKFIGGGRVKK
jgi:cell wall-associated NlpC family hydrolase